MPLPVVSSHAMKHILLCVALVLTIPACALLKPGGVERTADYATDVQPLAEKVARNTAAGVPWYQTSAELLAAIATAAFGAAGGIAGTRALRGPADKPAKLKVAAERMAKKAAAA